MKSPSYNPLYPRRTPYTSIPLFKHVLATARTAAFIPGASPPDVNTPIHLTIVFPPNNHIFISKTF